MRTRSNIFYGYGLTNGIKILNNFHSAGVVNVVCEDKRASEELCSELTKAGYKVNLYLFNDIKFKSDGFVLGYGGERTVRAVRRCGKKYAFFLTSVCAEAFCRFDERFAEFSYIDCEVFRPDDMRKVAECHCALMAVFTEGLSCLYADSNRPFTDKALKVSVMRALDILNGHADRAEYIKEALGQALRLYDGLLMRGVEMLTACEIAVNMGGGLENRFSSAYFLNRLLILFTKWNFRDMLIPAERTVAIQKPGRYEEADLLLDNDGLASIMSKVREFTTKPTLTDLVEAMKKSAFGSPLFAEIYNRGLPEGLIDYG